MKRYRRFYDHSGYTDLTLTQLNALTGVALLGSAVNPDVTNGNKIHNSPRGRVFLAIRNNSTTPGEDLQIDIPTPVTVTEGSSGDLTVQDPQITVGDGEEVLIGPFSSNFEDNDPSAGYVVFDWTEIGGLDASTDVDIQAYKIV